MNRLIYGMDGRSIDHLLGGGFVKHILISAGMLWTGKKFRTTLRLPEHDTLFLDSGGFSVLQRFGRYPYSAAEYAELARVLEADQVATMDYPCTVPNTRPSAMVLLTIEASASCHAIEGIPWVQVVQGETVGDYLDCCDRIKDRGFETPIMAVGSLVGRRFPDEVALILDRIQARFPAARLHAFGVGKRLLRFRRVRAALWSADTTAWRSGADASYRYPRTAEEKVMNFSEYEAWADAMLQFDKRQEALPA